ncbi:Processing alpha glucosidase I [Coemansia sp. RSA 1813]|nr:Processing alpha glucosidase I [Coemansia sp. RSA 1843]KAJ2571425.1 Processing alpha glucosidase I [Coemansia sp. RSA 1813]
MRSEEANNTQSELESDLLWGTYRPNLYFGTRPRLPNSLLSGLMWFGLDNQRGYETIRHSCELGDNLGEYGYARHNGRDFGEQTMLDTDHGVEIKSEFIKVPGKNGGSWAARFSGRTLNDDTDGVSLMYYFGLEGNGTMAMSALDDMLTIRGKTPELGRFNIRIVPAQSNVTPQLPNALHKVKGISSTSKISGVALKVPKTDVWRAKDFISQKVLTFAKSRILKIIEYTKSEGPFPGYVLFGMDTDIPKKKGKNLLFAQMVVQGEFSFDVIYECADEAAKIDAVSIEAIASNKRKEFDARFESVFKLREKGFSNAEVEMARNALSSLIGGIGYFYGSGLVSKDPKPEYGESDNRIAKPELSEPYSLFAAAPSRPFFPRGFLWDEGFQQLLLGHWDSDLSIEILRSWFHTMDSNGWIAREQILGDEARSKVPKEFQVQYPNFANPPTLLFPLEMLASWAKSAEISQSLNAATDANDMVQPIDTSHRSKAIRENLGEMAVYVSKMLEFFHRTQAGEVSVAAGQADGEQRMNAAHGFRWRGRTMDHTLTSGIDDYPRARPPNAGELHVDLYSWVTYMEMVNSNLAAYADSSSANATDEKTATSLDSKREMYLHWLDELHWNEDENMYCDVTVRVRDDFDELEDDESTATERVFVCHKGYISLFPVLLGLVPPDSAKLGHVLNIIEDPNELWTDYGIRSLSKSDQFYGKGEDYWRGPIWINVNYLLLSSLHRNYIPVEGPYQEQARRIYTNLRQNLIDNISKQYKESRFFWEQYNPEDGHGQGTHPFTGWTTLVVLIMAETY